ncbi:9184_t:CDS:1, partial [Racocetra fulgida]
YIELGSSISIDEKQDGHIYVFCYTYLAPEVLKSKCFTQAADINSFGIIIIEILTGRRPFDGYNFDAELAAIICHGFIIRTPRWYVQLCKR